MYQAERVSATEEGNMATIPSELREFFASKFGDALGVDTTEIKAQDYEPRGGAMYHPATDRRMVNLMQRQVGRSQWGRTRQVLDEMPVDVVSTLRLACRNPSALGLRVERVWTAAFATAERALMQATEDDFLAAAHHAGERALRDRVAEGRYESSIALATEVLRQWAVRTVEVPRALVEETAHAMIRHGDIDVGEEIDAIVSKALAVYAKTKQRILDASRARIEREDRRRAELRESLKAKREAKESVRFTLRMSRVSP